MEQRRPAGGPADTEIQNPTALIVPGFFNDHYSGEVWPEKGRYYCCACVQKKYRRTKEVGSIWHLISSLSRAEMQGIYFWKIRALPFDSKHIALVLQFVCPSAPADRPQQLGRCSGERMWDHCHCHASQFWNSPYKNKCWPLLLSVCLQTPVQAFLLSRKPISWWNKSALSTTAPFGLRSQGYLKNTSLAELPPFRTYSTPEGIFKPPESQHEWEHWLTRDIGRNFTT